MKHFTHLPGLIILALSFFLNGCSGQSPDKALTPVNSKNTQLVGGGCDGCEIMFIGMPAQINAVDTSTGWTEKGQKLRVTGTIFKADGMTPAPGVIVYYWQTDNNGYYSPSAGMDERARRHGHIRGWVKTGDDGAYSIYTIRPAPYPGQDMPAHIHLSVKEPGMNEYYVDELVFDDDKLLTGEKRKKMENRGGSGVLRVVLDKDMQVAEHDIILGLNIPGYPAADTAKNQSGLSVGEDSPSFGPYHAFGPDKGSQACPVCKYGRYHGILYFVGNHPDWNMIKKWLLFLEKESSTRSKYLKVYFVYGNENNYSKAAREKELEQIGAELGLKHTALTFVPSFRDKKTEVYLNRINPEVENTIIMYSHRSIIAKFINSDPVPENFAKLTTLLDKTRNNFFNLPEPAYE